MAIRSPTCRPSGAVKRLAVEPGRYQRMDTRCGTVCRSHLATHGYSRVGEGACGAVASLRRAQDNRDALLFAHYAKSLYRLPGHVRNAILTEAIG